MADSSDPRVSPSLALSAFPSFADAYVAAQRMADELGRCVDITNADGVVIEQVEPEGA